MRTVFNTRCQRQAAWITLLTLAASPLCSAQPPNDIDKQPVQVAAPSQVTAPASSAGPLPRSRRILSADEFATLVGQTLSLSVRTRWPRRVVKGTIVSVDTDTVSVDTGKAIQALPIAKTVVNTRLPGDFIELIGRKITVSGDRRFPPEEITGTVVSVDASRVNLDSDGHLHRLPIASTVVLSRTPSRDRRRAIIAGVALYIGGQLWVAHKCRNGGC